MDQSFLDKRYRAKCRKIGCRASVLIGLAVVAVTGGSASAAAPARSISLESFFNGQLRGAGSEKDFEHALRTVTFSGMGTRIPGGVRLAYNIVFSDGERQHKVWTFLKVGPGHYVGRRSDVVGDAQITQSGSGIHMTYTARVPTKSGAHDLSFDETFTQTGPRTIVNLLKANFLFVTVASGRITLQKAGG